MTDASDYPAVKAMSSDRIGVLILRLWMEPSHETGLRARIFQGVDGVASEESTAVAASADDISALVRSWVEAFAAPVTLP